MYIYIISPKKKEDKKNKDVFISFMTESQWKLY